jgi:hypothetical protein
MTALLVAFMLVLAACGENGENNDTILGGFSGVLIFGLIVWVVFRYVSKRKG